MSIKRAIKRGAWRVSNNKILSWKDLVSLSKLNQNYGVYEYHNMSLYAHSTYSSLELEATHNQEIDGLLCYFYVLASVFSVSVLHSFKIELYDESKFDKREIAIVTEFNHMANNPDLS